MILAASQAAFAANLVQNPSFETFSSCPGGISAPISLADGWSLPSLGSSDYMNSCAPSGTWSAPSNYWGTQTPASGNAYGAARIWASVPPNTSNDYREYLQGTLTQPLIAGHTYQVSFLVSLAEGNPTAAIVEIGAYLTPNPVNMTTGNVLPFTPQVVNTSGLLSSTTTWMPVTGAFTAAGGERYIVLGNFLDDASTTTSTSTLFRFGFYYFDDVSVEDLTAVPEPGSAALLGVAGAAALCLRKWRRGQAPVAFPR